MYNDGHLWRIRTEAANFRQRLATISRKKLLTYTVGCVTHAKDVLLAATDQYADNEYLCSAELLDTFWNQFPNSLNQAVIDALPGQAEQVVTRELGSQPDEHFLLS